ncbi:uncharacterized protein LOC130781195 [Actinidia eriantha]|uniref:uncharacterized protein LOC130781195 n=1 Tax=Actinidia eriantha TaxID=165200 RepID=UPI00258D59E7|nr:uncharacterized protein LOC130781195 [Actinidia eriantha]XP_057496283.1 uncharacterized protein LOC130781195 [Actinidia eriantha]XP_057496284.1 uncharacterized protein LOC130781195 [Actinidia eriantha]XP_057496285.1 uncharacterized protein LOC130781195 [Actinidia eriantha]XP_057496286.1 uncharacterized protein LOC130781195 [Actinidia eriantha]
MGLRLDASAIKDPAVATKLARSTLFLADMEMTDKMGLDEVAAQFYHVHTQALVFGSSLVEQVRRLREGVETRDVTISSLKGEFEQARREALIYQKRVAEIKDDKENVAAAKALFDLAREKLEKEVAELKRKEKEVAEAVVEHAKMLAVTEFKASEEYGAALTLEASRYYGEGFDLCKKQIKLRFPDLDIDNMEIDPNLAEEGDDDGKVDGDATLVEDPIPLGNQTFLGGGKKEGVN